MDNFIQNKIRFITNLKILFIATTTWSVSFKIRYRTHYKFENVIYVCLNLNVFIQNNNGYHYKLENGHCIKSVRIQSYPHFSHIFSHSDWIWRDTANQNKFQQSIRSWNVLLFVLKTYTKISTWILSSKRHRYYFQYV